MDSYQVGQFVEWNKNGHTGRGYVVFRYPHNSDVIEFATEEDADRYRVATATAGPSSGSRGFVRRCTFNNVTCIPDDYVSRGTDTYALVDGFRLLGEPKTDIASDNKNNAMPISEKFKLLFTSEPMKSFRKAGITNGDDMLTSEGRDVFLAWLLARKDLGAAFKKEVVDPILAEQKKKDCC